MCRSATTHRGICRFPLHKGGCLLAERPAGRSPARKRNPVNERLFVATSGSSLVFCPLLAAERTYQTGTALPGPKLHFAKKPTLFLTDPGGRSGKKEYNVPRVITAVLILPLYPEKVNHCSQLLPSISLEFVKFDNFHKKSICCSFFYSQPQFVLLHP